MQMLRSLALVLALALTAVVVGGCTTGSPGTKNVMGTVTTNISSPAEKVSHAAKAALEDLKLKDINAVITTIDGKITGKTADNTTVTVSVSTAGENVSKVDVRVGVGGDEALSLDILNRIKQKL